ncbi:magnesium transporter NIPA-domain-containing protein, partial [Umbelopsis sp. PMI_123]
MDTSLTSLPDSPEESHTYIGVVVSVCGNILISVALNLQKYAHNKLQQSANLISDANGTLPYSSPHIPNDDGFFGYRKSTPESDTTDYLKSKLWWMGISLMVIGEIGNFVAYGFAPASTIAPLGTTTLVSNVILAPLLLKERFRFRDILGVMFAMCGATVVVLSSKSEEIKASLSPELVVEYLTSMEAIIYYSITGGLILVLTALSPRWGSKSILIDLGLVALYGAYTVLSTKSVSSLLSLTFYKMFTYPVSYVLFLVLILTAIIQIKYLNKALQRFDATAVIPTQFVLFTISAIIGSAVLYRDFDDVNAQQFVRFVFGCIIEFLGVYLITSNR